MRIKQGKIDAANSAYEVISEFIQVWNSLWRGFSMGTPTPPETKFDFEAMFLDKVPQDKFNQAPDFILDISKKHIFPIASSIKDMEFDGPFISISTNTYDILKDWASCADGHLKEGDLVQCRLQIGNLFGAMSLLFERVNNRLHSRSESTR